MEKVHFYAPGLLAFTCPGCGYDHAVGVNGRKVPGEDGTMNEWQWNQSMTKPTFMPSLLLFKSDPKLRCHSYVKDGKIQFLDDCHHSLKGQTIDLPDWES